MDRRTTILIIFNDKSFIVRLSAQSSIVVEFNKRFPCGSTTCDADSNRVNRVVRKENVEFTCASGHGQGLCFVPRTAARGSVHREAHRRARPARQTGPNGIRRMAPPSLHGRRGSASVSASATFRNNFIAIIGLTDTCKLLAQSSAGMVPRRVRSTHSRGKRGETIK